MASFKTEEYHYDKQTLLWEHELFLAITQNNTIHSYIQTTELQSSKLIELNSLKAIKISDLTPGNSYDNKLRLSRGAKDATLSSYTILVTFLCYNSVPQQNLSYLDES